MAFLLKLEAGNITTILLLILLVLLVLVIYTQKDTFLSQTENFDNTEFDKFPKMTYVQDMELKKLLKITHVLLTQNKIDYSMCGGTLLGAIRHKNRIPWDDDADIFIFDKDEDKIEKIDWSKYGCKLHKHWIGYKLCFDDSKNAIENGNKMEWNYPFLDIFVVAKFSEKSILKENSPLETLESLKSSNNKDRWTYKNEKCRSFWPNDYLYSIELFPLKLYQFGDIMLYGPNKVYSYLTRYFGVGWETNVEMKTSHIVGKDLKTINFTLCDYAKKYNLEQIKYLWIIGTSKKHPEDYLVEKFNKDYTLIFINKNTLGTYLPDIYNEKLDLNLEDDEQIKLIRSLLFKKHGGKFLVFE
jgi:phosphorylcholine metabolism protein LicD